MSRVECERNVCENELNRLRYGLEKLLRNNGYNNVEIPKKSWINRNDDENEFRDSFISAPLPLRMKHDLRKRKSDLRTIKTPIDPTYKSLLYKILEAKLFECLSTNQRVDKTPSDSVSIISSIPPHHITPQLSTTETISSLESSSFSAFPSETPKLTHTLEVNDYEKSTLTVPKPSSSRSKKSKKRKISNKKSHLSKKKKLKPK